MKLIRNILIIFVPVYYIITWWRNKLYDVKICSSKSYELPIICVGNLSVGGTGKTPMIEYLIRLLKKNYSIATLSRGYKRKTKGFRIADKTASIETIGDEPLQLHQKFNNVTVSVDANRQRGIANLIERRSKLDVILLDDAFQHRKVNAGLNILLTSYHRLYTNDILLPTGDLREPISGAKRAQIIVVTKCPQDLSLEDKKSIVKKLSLTQTQNVFFSSIVYMSMLESEIGSKPLEELRNANFTLVTGIAYAEPLKNYLKSQDLKFDHLEFGDHHNFTDSEIALINSKELVLTTEKDFWRLHQKIDAGKLYYIPIEMRFSEGTEEFNGLITQFVKH